MAAPIVIDVKKLNVRRDIPILTDISWRVRRGEHWVLLGANGSGKTSLLNALTGYLTPSTGEVTVLGQTYGLSDWRDLRLRIGLVSASLIQRIEPGETALETVASGQSAMINYWGELPADKRAKAKAILKQVECPGLAGREWRYLSQGERQRVIIGRALMADFKLLLLDEPCAGLDPVARERFLRFLGRLAKRKGALSDKPARSLAVAAPTLVLVTHHVEEIRPFFSHVALIKSGRMLAAGPLKNTLTSARVSAVFDAPLKLVSSTDGFTLKYLKTKSAAK